MLKSRESMVLRLARRVIPMPTRKWLKSRMHAGISARLLVHFRHGFLEVEPLLKHIKLNGFSPETIIDGGHLLVTGAGLPVVYSRRLDS